MRTEDRDYLEKEWLAHRARERAQFSRRLLEAGEFSIELVQASDDVVAGEASFQEELRRFAASLRNAGVPLRQMIMTQDAVEAHSFGLPEFILALKHLSKGIIPIAAGYAARWVNERAGRKIRISIGDVTAEAHTMKEIEQLLQKAAEFKNDSEAPKIVSDR
jgi:hypothetical protein